MKKIKNNKKTGTRGGRPPTNPPLIRRSARRIAPHGAGSGERTHAGLRESERQRDEGVIHRRTTEASVVIDQTGKKTKYEKRKDPPQPQGVKSGLLPAFPCVFSFSGLSKSGKSTLIKEVLTDKKLMGGFFHTVVFFSPTADADTTITSELDLPEENIYTDFTEEDLDEIIQARRAEIKKKGYNKVAKTNRMLIILDDIISNQSFLKSRMIVDLCATVRHLLITTIFAVQSFNRVPRVCRLNLRGIAFFQANRNEVDILIEEVCPPHLSKTEFRDLIRHATDEKYSFLFINRDQPFIHRYRKKFDTVLELIDR